MIEIDKHINSLQHLGYTSFNLKDYNIEFYKKIDDISSKYNQKNDYKYLRADFDSDFKKEKLIEEVKKINKNFDIQLNVIDTHFQCTFFLDKNDNEILENSYSELINFIYSFSYKISQIWRFSGYVSPEENEVFNLLIHDVYKNFFKEKITNINITNQNCIQKTYYSKNCFLERHQDGSSQTSLFVILVYLDKNYHHDNGGFLILGNEKNEKIVYPTFGNVAIINFNNHDPFHEVKKVESGDGRIAYLSFVKRENNELSK